MIGQLLDKVWTPSATKPKTDGIPDDRYGRRRRLAYRSESGSGWAR